LCPFTIEFEPRKLEEIRAAVLEGFYAVPRGGVEIGGVLYGKRENGKLAILDYRTIETEYLTGPSFRLSEKDLAGLRALLAETKFEDPEMLPVGWFLSHTRSPICLSGQDLEIHREFFSEPWQVALVLKPDTAGKVRGGYFFRQAGGVLKADSSLCEFPVAPYFEGRPSAEQVSTAELELPPVSGKAPAVEARMEPLAPTQEVVLPPSAPTAASAPEPNQPEPDRALPELFQSISPEPKISVRKKWFFAIFALASAGAALAGYWVATH
jgi:proteasome lid subunit RPN8/RPN11